MNITSLIALGAAALMFLKKDETKSQDKNIYSDPEGDAEKALQNALNTGTDLSADDALNLDGEEDGYYNANVEKSDLKVFGLMRLGNMNITLNRANLSVFVTNDSKTTSYFIKKVSADAYIYSEKVGFKKDQVKEVNVVLQPGQTIEIQLGNSECYMSGGKTQRDKIRTAIKNKSGYSTASSKSNKTDLGAIAEIDVNLEWQPRSGAGEPIAARYTGKPCDVRYIDEAYYS